MRVSVLLLLVEVLALRLEGLVLLAAAGLRARVAAVERVLRPVAHRLLAADLAEEQALEVIGALGNVRAPRLRLGAVIVVLVVVVLLLFLKEALMLEFSSSELWFASSERQVGARRAMRLAATSDPAREAVGAFMADEGARVAIGDRARVVGLHGQGPAVVAAHPTQPHLGLARRLPVTCAQKSNTLSLYILPISRVALVVTSLGIRRN